MHYDVGALRAHFPALAEGAAHFDGPGGSQVPEAVGSAVASTLTAAIANRDPSTAAGRRAEEVVVESRAAVADLLGAEPGGVVWGRSMTALTYEMSRALAKGWGPGDEVVVTSLDHDANIRPWVQAAEGAGATVRWAELDPATGELPAAAVTTLLGERTRLVAVTGASNLLGTRPDVAAIAAAAHDVGAVVYVDGVHLTPHAPVDVQALGADVYACSPYKWLGPHCGVLAADPTWLAGIRADKLLPSSDDVPERFELGTLPYELLAGATAAVDFLAAMGGIVGAPAPPAATRRERVLASMAAVEAWEEGLREELEASLDELPGVVLHGRAQRRTPTLLVSFERRRSAAVAAGLAERGVNAPSGSFYAVEASRRIGLGDEGALRIGLAPYSSPNDLDRLISGLRQLI